MGFQFQPNHPTIQGEIEKAIYKLTGDNIRVRGASRTDSGVHAVGQVVDALVRCTYPINVIHRALNHYLPMDIRIQKTYEMDTSFHSRKDAEKRTYRYNILNQAEPSPIRRATHYWLNGSLDCKKMSTAAEDLIGTHDFRHISKGVAPEKSAVRKVFIWNVSQQEECITIECEATGFLRQQIRRANAILIEIGKNNWPETAIKDTLENKFYKGRSHPILPAQGLCLTKVTYNNFFNKVIDGYETN
jgi:tRNA pseudouridine38-40 synthase